MISTENHQLKEALSENARMLEALSENSRMMQRMMRQNEKGQQLVRSLMLQHQAFREQATATMGQMMAQLQRFMAETLAARAAEAASNLEHQRKLGKQRCRSEEWLPEWVLRQQRTKSH